MSRTYLHKSSRIYLIENIEIRRNTQVHYPIVRVFIHERIWRYLRSQNYNKTGINEFRILLKGAETNTEGVCGITIGSVS